MIPVAEMEQRKRVKAIRALGNWSESLVSVRNEGKGKRKTENGKRKKPAYSPSGR